MQRQREIDAMRRTSKVYGVTEEFIRDMLDKNVHTDYSKERHFLLTTADSKEQQERDVRPPRQRSTQSTEQHVTADIKPPADGDYQEGAGRRSRDRGTAERRSQHRSDSRSQDRRSEHDRYQPRDDRRSPVRYDDAGGPFYANRRGNHYEPSRTNRGSRRQYTYGRGRTNNLPRQYDTDKKRSRSRSRDQDRDKRPDRRSTPPSTVSAADAARDARIDMLAKSVEALISSMKGRNQPR